MADPPCTTWCTAFGPIRMSDIVALKARPNHCCPVCGHPVGAKRWFWRSWIWARWNCESCGTLLRFDSRRRLLFSLFMGLLFIAVLGIAVAFMLFRISPWIWAVPLFVAYVFGFVFVVRHGDRIVVAAPGGAGAKSEMMNFNASGCKSPAKTWS